jgi:hypothetical protein
LPFGYLGRRNPSFTPVSDQKPYHGPKTVPRNFAGILRSLLCLVALLVLTAAPTNAATKYYSTFAKNNVAPPECVQEIHIVNPLIAQFHGPADWTWIVACDEPAWQRFELMSGFQKAVNGEVMGLTDLDRHITYVRGYMILHPLSQSIEAQPRHIVAHELGHILLNTHDEEKAERKGMELLNESTIIASK